MLDKAIASGQEYRRPYRDARAIDRTCRNHGTCDYCKNTRTHQDRRDRIAALDELVEQAQEWGMYV